MTPSASLTSGISREGVNNIVVVLPGASWMRPRMTFLYPAGTLMVCSNRTTPITDWPTPSSSPLAPAPPEAGCNSLFGRVVESCVVGWFTGLELHLGWDWFFGLGLAVIGGCLEVWGSRVIPSCVGAWSFPEVCVGPETWSRLAVWSRPEIRGCS